MCDEEDIRVGFNTGRWGTVESQGTLRISATMVGMLGFTRDGWIMRRDSVYDTWDEYQVGLFAHTKRHGGGTQAIPGGGLETANRLLRGQTLIEWHVRGDLRRHMSLGTLAKCLVPLPPF